MAVSSTFPPGTSSDPRYFYSLDGFPALQELVRHTEVIRDEVLKLEEGFRAQEEAVKTKIAGNFGSWSGERVFESVAAQLEGEGGWVKWWNHKDPRDPTVLEGVDWTVYGFIYQPGCYLEANGERCPETFRLLKEIPNVRVAGFSRLKPGTEIAPHTGFTGKSFNSLAFHLGLIIPEGKTCGLQVANEVHHWTRMGETIIFDDTFSHSAWNRSDQTRIILYIDFIPTEEQWNFYSTPNDQ